MNEDEILNTDTFQINREALEKLLTIRDKIEGKKEVIRLPNSQRMVVIIKLSETSYRAVYRNLDIAVTGKTRLQVLRKLFSKIRTLAFQLKQEAENIIDLLHAEKN